jgi:hypothetical protein
MARFVYLVGIGTCLFLTGKACRLRQARDCLSFCAVFMLFLLVRMLAAVHLDLDLRLFACAFLSLGLFVCVCGLTHDASPLVQAIGPPTLFFAFIAASDRVRLTGRTIFLPLIVWLVCASLRRAAIVSATLL